MGMGASESVLVCESESTCVNGYESMSCVNMCVRVSAFNCMSAWVCMCILSV